MAQAMANLLPDMPTITHFAESLLILALGIVIFALYNQRKLWKLSQKLENSLPFHHILSIFWAVSQNH